MRVLVGLTIVASVLTACGDGNSESTSTSSAPTTTSTSTTTIAVTTTTTVPPTATAPPAPSSFSEVESEYSMAVSAILNEGRATVDQLVEGEFEVLHAQFDTQMASQVSVEDLRSAIEGQAAQAPLGPRLVDRALPLDPSRRGYGAEVAWGDQVVTVSMMYDDEWRISSLLLTPPQSLGEDPAANFESDVSYRVPFEGLWFVFWGGDVALQNYHVVAQDQRHALDLVVWKDGGTHQGDGTANEDYWAYGQKVIAPAGGTVVAAIDGLPDNLPQVGSDPANPAGNHVVIKVADGEYVLIAHMQPGTLTVSEGDTVEQGQEIGLVGNSGNTSEPHIHIHVQDEPGFDPSATGLPLVFSSYMVNDVSVDSGELKADQFVSGR